MSRERISVVVPCYNLGEFLPEAVESVRHQSCADWDLTVVNDGSTDLRTLEELRALARQGVHVLHTKNRGAPAARNHGIAHSDGAYVLCLDADDMLLPDFLAETSAVLDREPEVGIVGTFVEFFGHREGVWRPHGFQPVTMLWRNCVSGNSLFRRECWEAVGGYKDLDGCQDWEFWISIIEAGWRWSIVEQILFRYRQRSGSISEDRESRREELLRQIVALHSETYAEHWPDILVEMDAELKRLRDTLNRQSARIRQRREAEREMRKAAQAAIRGLEQVLDTRPSTPTEKSADTESRESPDASLVRRSVAATVPTGASVLVISKGDDALVRLQDREGHHFPRTHDGRYLGYHPGDSAEAIGWLEAERARGAEFLVLPALSQWWLEYYEGLRRHLNRTYRAISRSDACTIWDLRSEAEVHGFSVVICTHNRGALITRAIESVIAQDYPHDRFEILVVDNASTDETPEIIAELAPRSPVPFRVVREETLGLSHARNRGIAEARFEYVAFLDDDAIACFDWLQSINTVINEQHALVVGTRIEKTFPEGFIPPRWFDAQYVKHFFGVNYRDLGRHQRVIRIRHPLYLTGASIAYARRLFDRFGGFDPRLGRIGRSLLAGEETYLNMVLEKNDVPIYYTDEGHVHHYIEPFRVTRRHIASKAWWSGITAALLQPMFFGLEKTRERSSAAWREIGRRIRQILRKPGSDQTFARLCRIVYNTGFLTRFWRLYASMRWRGEDFDPPPLVWSLEDWIDEVRRWPDGADKHRALHDLYMEAGDVKAAEAERIELSRYGPEIDEGGGRSDVRAALLGPLHRLRYDRLVQRVKEVGRERVPSGATILVASKGDDRLIDLGTARGWHFPRDESGVYAGHYPENDDDAIAHVESLRRLGADFLLFPSTAFWWLERYPGFGRHLERTYRRAWQDDDVAIFDLRQDGKDDVRAERTGSR